MPISVVTPLCFSDFNFIYSLFPEDFYLVKGKIFEVNRHRYYKEQRLNMYLSILLTLFTVALGLKIKENNFYNVTLETGPDLREISIHLNATELCTSTKFTTCDEYILEEYKGRITWEKTDEKVKLELQARADGSGRYIIQESYRDGTKHQNIENITVLCNGTRQKRDTGNGTRRNRDTVDPCCSENTTPGGKEDTTEVTTTVSHTNDPEDSTAFPEGGVNVPVVVIPVVVVVLLIILICIVICLRKRRRQL